MKPQWKTMVVTGALFFGQIVFMGMPLSVSASYIPGTIINWNTNLVFANPYTSISSETIVMWSTTTITAPSMSIAGQLIGAGKINTSTLNVLAGGTLDLLSHPLQVTGAVTMSDGSEFMIGATPKPRPLPGGEGLTPAEMNVWLGESHTVYTSVNGELQVTKGISGPDMIALGITPKPHPLPGGTDPGLFASSLTLESGSTLNFTFAAGYTPAVGDWFSLADCSLTIGEGAEIMSNLGAGWVMFNSGETTLEYIRASVPEPSTLLLFGTGLAGLIGGWLKRQKKE
jgi:hypothetical protein